MIMKIPDSNQRNKAITTIFQKQSISFDVMQKYSEIFQKYSLFTALNALKESSAISAQVRILGDIVTIKAKLFEEFLSACHVEPDAYGSSRYEVKRNILASLKINQSIVDCNKYLYTLSKADWDAFKTFMNTDYTKKQVKEDDEEAITTQKTVKKTSKIDSDSDASFNKAGCYFVQCEVDAPARKYKIGRAKDIYDRIFKAADYRNCRVLCIMGVDGSRYEACETELIARFRKMFTWIKHADKGNFGNEWFEIDDENVARGLFITICQKYA